MAIAFLMVANSPQAQADDINPRILKRDFMHVVMSAEFGGHTKFGRSVKKYDVPVRMAIINHAQQDRRGAVRAFVQSVEDKVNGLDIDVVSRPSQANFRIHVVDSVQYASVIRNEIYKSEDATVRGTCFVRVIPGKRGIGASDVVIVSDLGDFAFERCLVEEVLQGLGPLADRGHPRYSVFNTKSRHNTFTPHDQILMNALYDERVKPGMSKSEVRQILPDIIRDSIARVMKRNAV